MEVFTGIGAFIIAYGFIFYQGYNLDKFSNRGIVYGVRIPEEHKDNDEIRKSIKRYKKRYILILPLFILITSALAINFDSVVILIYSLIGTLLISEVIYIFSWKEMKVIKKRNGWKTIGKNLVIVDMKLKKKNSNNEEKMPLSSKNYLWGLLVILITIIITLALYKNLPETFPVHFNGKGIADRYAAKGTMDGYISLAVLPITQVGMLIMFWGIHILTVKVKKNLNSGTVRGTLKQQNIFKRYLCMYLFVIGIEMEVMFLLIQLTYFYPKYIPMVSGGVGIIIMLTCFLGMIPLLKIGQGGKNIKVEEEGEVIYRDDDDLYILGNFYYNKEDPALMVQKRMGLGMDFNYAKPIAWIFIFITFIILIGALVYIPFNDKSLMNF